MSDLPPGVVKFMGDMESKNKQLIRSGKMKDMVIVLLLAAGIGAMMALAY